MLVVVRFVGLYTMRNGRGKCQGPGSQLRLDVIRTSLMLSAMLTLLSKWQVYAAHVLCESHSLYTVMWIHQTTSTVLHVARVRIC